MGSRRQIVFNRNGPVTLMSVLALKSSNEKLSVWGIGMVLTYNFLSSAKEVASGSIVQTIAPMALTAFVFLIVLLVFQVLSAAQGAEVYKAPLLDKSLIFKLNLFSCGSWIGFFYSVKFLEPAIVSALMVGLGPALSTILIPLWHKDGAVRRVDVLGAIGILMSTAYILHVVATGNSSLGNLTISDILHGGVSALLGSVSMVGSSIFSKKLSNVGARPVAIMAHRFYLLVLAAFSIALLSNTGFGWLWSYWAPVLALAVFGVILPLWALQIGLKHLEPMYVMILISTAPGFACMIQLLDPRLAARPEVYFGVALLCGSAILSQVPWLGQKLH
jgi:drug/metabolite transporter (DMT)-like permease